MSWTLVSLVVLAASPEVKMAAPAPAVGTQWHAESKNFTVRSYHPAHNARQVAEHCERWRSKLQQYWCAGPRAAWERKCEVVAHANGRSYAAATGGVISQTFGSSLLQFGPHGAVSLRRIDFRGDSTHGLAAVPHEMTHVVVADLLDGKQPPRWADEGMAILADERSKQLLHERDLARGLTGGTAFRVAELLTLDAYPAAARVATFYGQSASLTAVLAKRDDPARFIEFLRRSQSEGYDRALQEIYHVKNIAQLERVWQDERLAWRNGFHGMQLALDAAGARDAAGAD